MDHETTRRSFLQSVAAGSFGAVAATAWLGNEVLGQNADAKTYGEAGVKTSERPKGVWQPVSDRKIRLGIVGGNFGLQFDFHDHPNVTVAAVSDLIPARLAALAKHCHCEKTYPSLEELVKDETIDAVILFTDAPSHVQHCLEVLKHGKHVASAVPAVWGSVDDAHRLFEAVRSSGPTKYMMFETSAYHDDCHAMREIYRAGGFGKLVYSEGEYFHYMPHPIPSFHDWRVGLPPQWYPTHANAYYVCVTGESFTDVSCMGMRGRIKDFQPDNNRYKNPFSSEVALLRTSEGGMARMVESWDTPGFGNESGRVRGQLGSMVGMEYEGKRKKNLPSLDRPPLPPKLRPGGHGGSHGFLVNEFVTAILEDRKPLVDVTMALNLTVPGIIAHQSALKDGECLKIPQFA